MSCRQGLGSTSQRGAMFFFFSKVWLRPGLAPPVLWSPGPLVPGALVPWSWSPSPLVPWLLGFSGFLSSRLRWLLGFSASVASCLLGFGGFLASRIQWLLASWLLGFGGSLASRTQTTSFPGFLHESKHSTCHFC